MDSPTSPYVGVFVFFTLVVDGLNSFSSARKALWHRKKGAFVNRLCGGVLKCENWSATFAAYDSNNSDGRLW